jgi:DNA-binding MarR family transcriptional regulator
MSMDLRSEIKQTRPFRSLYEEASLNIARTESILRASMDDVLALYGLSATQYNVLRILRGAGAAGLCRNEIRSRLISRMPDVSRLVDRLEEAGLVERKRSTADRREVNTILTRRGRDLVDRLDPVVAAEHASWFGHMSPDELQTLTSLLTRVRNKG